MFLVSVGKLPLLQHKDLLSSTALGLLSLQVEYATTTSQAEVLLKVNFTSAKSPPSSSFTTLNE